MRIVSSVMIVAIVLGQSLLCLCTAVRAAPAKVDASGPAASALRVDRAHACCRSDEVADRATNSVTSSVTPAPSPSGHPADADGNLPNCPHCQLLAGLDQPIAFDATPALDLKPRLQPLLLADLAWLRETSHATPRAGDRFVGDSGPPTGLAPAVIGGLFDRSCMLTT